VEPREGVFAIYKPVGPTSNDVLNSLRRVFGTKKIGHAGTLDPLAKGVLVVGVGREATRKLGEVAGSEKEYLAKIRLGMTSTTDDEEGEKSKTKSPKVPSAEEVRAVLNKFVGKIRQVPPIFSAVKVRGKEAYKLARQGKVVKLSPREVIVKDIRVLKYKWPYLSLRAVTGPGVYVRALARDAGKKLGVGGYLASLERTRVGNFTKEKAVRLKELLS